MFTFKNRKFKMLAAGVMLSLAMGLMTGCGGEKKKYGQYNYSKSIY